MSEPPGSSKRPMEQIASSAGVKMRRLDLYNEDTGEQYFIITAISDDGLTVQSLNNEISDTLCVKESNSDDEQNENSETFVYDEEEVVVKTEEFDNENLLDVKQEPGEQGEIVTDLDIVDLTLDQDILIKNEPLQNELEYTVPEKPSVAVADQAPSKEKIFLPPKVVSFNKHLTDIGPGPWVQDDDSSMRYINFTNKQSWLKPKLQNPFEYFEYFIEDDYLNELLIATNQNALSKKYRKSDAALLRDWTDVTLAELKIFIGLLLHTGTGKLTYVGDYWRQHRLYRSCFNEYMTPQRFTQVLNYLAFPNNEKIQKNCYTQYHPMADHFNSVMDNIYYPGRNLSINIRKIDFDVPLNEHKCPIKVVFVHNHDGPIIKIVLDSRRALSIDAETVMIKLLEQKFNVGHAVYVDEEVANISPTIARAFLRNDTYCTGILNRTQVEASPVYDHLKNDQCKSLFFEGVQIGKHGDSNAPTFFLTTEFKKDTEAVAPIFMPETLRVYNEMRKDPHDEIFKYWPCEVNKLQYHKKLFVYTLLVSIYNANKLCNMFSRTKLNYHAYRLLVIERLLPASPEVPKPVGNMHKLVKICKRTTRQIGPDKFVSVTSRLDCKNCMLVKQRRNNTIYQCNGCFGYPAFCMECFFDVHKFVANPS